MSGIAIAASTIPGSVATFWSCSSERSVRMASSSSASAKTRAGTRMSARALAGISHSASSTRRGSDIEHERGPPARVAALEAQPVVGDGLDEVARAARASRHARLEPVLAELELREPERNEALHLRAEHEVPHELREERLAVRRPHPHPLLERLRAAA